MNEFREKRKKEIEKTISRNNFINDNYWFERNEENARLNEELITLINLDLEEKKMKKPINNLDLKEKKMKRPINNYNN